MHEGVVYNTSIASLSLVQLRQFLISKHRGFGGHADGIICLHTNSFARTWHTKLKIGIFACCLLSRVSHSVLDGIEDRASQEEWRLTDGLATVDCNRIVNVLEKRDVEDFRLVVKC